MNQINQKWIEGAEDARRCHALMLQLRPQLGSADEWVSRWQRQRLTGYQLLALTQQDEILALAGFRIQENLAHGRFLYVDDLVTEQTQRSTGLGTQMMDRLKQQAMEQGCAKLVLDTALSNALGQRFYFRQGLLSSSLRFTLVLGD